MKILVACELPEFAIAELRTLTTEIVHRPDARPDELRELIPGVGILVVDGRRVSPDTIQRGEALQMIVHAGPGPGDIAVADASAQGVFVTNCPDQHAVAVAELAFGLILALDRRIVDSTVALREGRWNRSEAKDARGLAGRTLGLLGAGPACREIAARAQAFGMPVIAWCPASNADDHASNIRLCTSARELARTSDIVVVTSLANGQEARLLADADFLENMKEGRPSYTSADRARLTRRRWPRLRPCASSASPRMCSVPSQAPTPAAFDHASANYRALSELHMWLRSPSRHKTRPRPKSFGSFARSWFRARRCTASTCSNTVRPRGN